MKAPQPLSTGEETLLLHLKAMQMPSPEREYRFHDTRRWRFDFAWPDRRLACEVEGGTGRNKSRHTRPGGFELDAEKYNTAALLGWRVLRVTSDMVRDGRAINLLREALQLEAI